MAKNKDNKNPDEPLENADGPLENAGEPLENSGDVPVDGEPIIRDKRRIDPETGDVRDASADDASDLDDELKRLIESDEADGDAAEKSGPASESDHLAD